MNVEATITAEIRRMRTRLSGVSSRLAQVDAEAMALMTEQATLEDSITEHESLLAFLDNQVEADAES